METFYFIMQHTMFFAIPLLIVAIGGMYSERSGIVNIALEGIMLMGAFFGIVFLNTYGQNHPGNFTLFLAFLIGGLTGGIFSLFHAFASINMKADQVISGTALNMFAPAFAIYVARMQTGTQQVPFMDSFRIHKVPILGDIPILGPILFQKTYITVYIGLAIFAIAAYVIAKTKFGLRLRACGEHPGAADSVGINVLKIRYAGTFISGVLAGLGGVVFVVPTSTNFNATVSGYGFLALAVLIFGQWRSGKIFAAAFFFGIMMTLANAYTVIPFLANLPISDYVYKMIPFIATLIALTFSSKKTKAPLAEGIPYDKGAR